MKKIIEYLRRLAANNNREWFNAHKDEYLECKACFDGFTEKLIAGIREFDESIGPLSPQDCTYRIYRDTRFSADKTPYKIHMGAFIVPGGKKSGYAGYYLQIGAQDDGFPGGCMLATGDYCYEPKVVTTLREDISLDNGEEFESVLAAAPGFRLDFDGALKKVPKGYPADKPFSEYLRLKNYCLIKDTGTDYMMQPGLLERALSDFRTTKPFLDFVNRAITYVNHPDD